MLSRYRTVANSLPGGQFRDDAAALYSSVCPFCRPKPFTSVTVFPLIPILLRASFTSSSLNGFMMASIFFISYLPHLALILKSCTKAVQGSKRRPRLTKGKKIVKEYFLLYLLSEGIVPPLSRPYPDSLNDICNEYLPISQLARLRGICDA